MVEIFSDRMSNVRGGGGSPTEGGRVQEEVKGLLKTSDTNDIFLIKNFNLAN